MDNCVFVDAEDPARRDIDWNLSVLLGASKNQNHRAGGKQTLRYDWDDGDMPKREALRVACHGALRAAALVDAELDWLIGGPLKPGRPMWTLTETDTGDQHASADS